MADGLARSAGAGVWLKDREGKDYYLSGAIGAEAELEQHMLSQRKNVVDALLPEYERLMAMTDAQGRPNLAARKMAEDMRRDALNQLSKNANERRVPPEDQIAYLRTREGFCWFLWRQLAMGASEQGLVPPTLEKATEIYEVEQEKGRQQGEADRARRLSEQVSGTDLASSSPGRMPESGSTSTPADQVNQGVATLTDSQKTENAARCPGTSSFEASQNVSAGVPSSFAA
jgi:hypothetical protein